LACWFGAAKDKEMMHIAYIVVGQFMKPYLGWNGGKKPQCWVAQCFDRSEKFSNRVKLRRRKRKRGGTTRAESGVEERGCEKSQTVKRGWKGIIYGRGNGGCRDEED
jgi:hypothetical protein